MSSPPILASQKWPTNGHLIADVAKMGYLRKEWKTLDPTYGEGVFWSVWAPDELVASDLDPDKSPIGYPIDATNLPYEDREFGASVFDGPYRLNGKPDMPFDERYGITVRRDWRWRMRLLTDGVKEVGRVTNYYMLVKCQDQVVGSKIRWQTEMIREAAESVGFGQKDRFDFPSYRKQPEGRNQLNAHRCFSQLLVFKRGWKWR